MKKKIFASKGLRLMENRDETKIPKIIIFLLIGLIFTVEYIVMYFLEETFTQNM